MDFALWKAAKPGEPTWDSPWGPGRPGWHIECSAMSLHLLGPALDIHGGGADLVFPHHENEIAQSEAYTGQAPLTSFWVHNGLLRQDENKMSKSLGNLVTIREALSQVGPVALRLYLLSSHYRSSLAYSAEGLAAQARALERLREAAALPHTEKADEVKLDAAPFRERFLSAMDDDLNTPQALAALFDLAREINRLALEDGDIAEGQETLRELAGVLGVSLEPDSAALAGAEPFLDLLVEVRQELRAARQFDLADGSVTAFKTWACPWRTRPRAPGGGFEAGGSRPRARSSLPQTSRPRLTPGHTAGRDEDLLTDAHTQGRSGTTVAQSDFHGPVAAHQRYEVVVSGGVRLAQTDDGPACNRDSPKPALHLLLGDVGDQVAKAVNVDYVPAQTVLLSTDRGRSQTSDGLHRFAELLRARAQGEVGCHGPEDVPGVEGAAHRLTPIARVR